MQLDQDVNGPAPPPAAERPPAGRTSTMLRLRVATFNTHLCQRLEAVCELLRALQADVIFLQEVIVDDPLRRPVNQAAWLAERLGYQHVGGVVFPAARHGLAGNAILTRGALSLPARLVGPSGHQFGLAAVLEPAGARIALLCMHLTCVPRPLPVGILASTFDRTAQVRRVLQWAKRHRLPAVVAGDGNFLPRSPEYRTMTTRLLDSSRQVPINNRNTRPTWGLPVQLDYIFTTRHFRTLSCVCMETNLSDHRPVAAEIEIAAQSKQTGRF